MKEYKLYLFDYDYTLVNSEKGIILCFRSVLDAHGHRDISDERIKKTIGMTLEDAFAVLTGVWNRQVLAAYKDEYTEKARECMSDNTVLFPETIAVLTALKERKACVGIVSTKYRYSIMELMNRYFPSSFWDIVVGVEDVEEPKPSPMGVYRALRQLGVDKPDVLFVGDSAIDARTAQAAGVDFAGVLHGATPFEELVAYPHVSMMADLTALL